MRIGYPAPLWAGAHNDSGLRPAIDKTAAAGFDPIRITPMDPDKAEAIAVRKMLEDAGLGLTGSLGTKETP